MLCGGDEMGHTQKGNNNAYCQDNEISWLDWDLDESRKKLLEFTQRIIRIYNKQPVFHRSKFFQGRALRGSEAKDITFLEPSGQEMTDEAWNAGFVRSLGIRLAGDMIDEVNEQGDKITGDTFLLLLNGHHENMLFTLPEVKTGHQWELMVDTADPEKGEHPIRRGIRYELKNRSTALLRQSKKK